MWLYNNNLLQNISFILPNFKNIILISSIIFLVMVASTYNSISKFYSIYFIIVTQNLDAVFIVLEDKKSIYF